MLGADPVKVDALNVTWRAERDAPLTWCKAARSDGECYHAKCPQLVPGKRKPTCPLPWVWDKWDDVG